MGPASSVPWTGLGGGAVGRWFRWDHRRSRPATWVPARSRAGERCGTAYPSGGRGFDLPRGAAPRRAPTRRGPPFLPRNGGKRARGESFSPLDSLLWFLEPCKGSSLFSAWPAALYLTPVTARPPAGRAGRGGFADGKGLTLIEFKNSTKKAPQIRACTWAPKQPNYRPAAPPNAKTSERQQAGHKKWGGGGPPPRLFASGLSLEKAWIPARDRAGTHPAGANLRRS